MESLPLAGAPTFSRRRFILISNEFVKTKQTGHAFALVVTFPYLPAPVISPGLISRVPGRSPLGSNEVANNCAGCFVLMVSFPNVNLSSSWREFPARMPLALYFPFPWNVYVTVRRKKALPVQGGKLGRLQTLLELQPMKSGVKITTTTSRFEGTLCEFKKFGMFFFV